MCTKINFLFIKKIKEFKYMNMKYKEQISIKYYFKYN